MERLKRKIDNYLIEWKNNPDKLPLIVKGARQIGKTNAIRNFGEKNYKSFIEINFVFNPEFKSIFSRTFNVNEILKHDNYLLKSGINIPKMIDLSLKLNFYNLLDEVIMDTDRMVDTLWR